MTDPRYGATYKAIRKAWAGVVARGEATCSEPICKMPTRNIVPGSKWHLSHDPTATRIIGPSHAFCNTSEAGTRARRNEAERFLKL